MSSAAAAPAAPRYVLMPSGSAAATRAQGLAQSSYVYQQSAPSTLESVLLSILNPGVNSQTVLVLNGTLGALSLCIGGMIYLFGEHSPTLRFQLWIFLAITTSLMLSVNWLMVRYGGGEPQDEDDDDEEEGESESEEDSPKPAPRASKAAKTKKLRASDDAAPASSATAKPSKAALAAAARAAAQAALDAAAALEADSEEEESGPSRRSGSIKKRSRKAE